MQFNFSINYILFQLDFAIVIRYNKAIRNEYGGQTHG